jgi:predicted Zn finger-like uncharacterized protein
MICLYAADRSVAKRGQRPRAARRLAERAARELVRERDKLFALGPGGSAARAIDVVSSAVIEPRARALPCPQCEGSLQVTDHQAEDAQLRRLEVRCARCGTTRTLFFRIVPRDN